MVGCVVRGECAVGYGCGVVVENGSSFVGCGVGVECGSVYCECVVNCVYGSSVGCTVTVEYGVAVYV